MSVQATSANGPEVTDDQIAAAQGYENVLVPALMGDWPDVVLEAAEVQPGDSLLDVGCGTGVLARRALNLVGEVGEVAGLVLRPGGRAVVAVWDDLDRNPGYADEVRLLEQEAGTDAADAVRVPFRLGDTEEMVGSLEDAGLTDVEVKTHGGWARFPSVRAMVEADLRGWLPIMGVQLRDAQIEQILAEAEDALADHVQPDGQVIFETSAHVACGATQGWGNRRIGASRAPSPSTRIWASPPTSWTGPGNAR